MRDSYNSRTTLKIKGKDYHIYSLKALMPQYPINQLPYCLKILLENLLRFEDGSSVSRSDIEALANWQPDATPAREIAFRPARVVLQDFTGVPAVVDLAAMREAMQDLQGDPELINPLTPVELVIDHSVQVDVYRTWIATLKLSLNVIKNVTPFCVGDRILFPILRSFRRIPVLYIK